MPLALCQVAALLGFNGHGPLLASRSPPRGATRSDGRSGPEPLLSPYLEERKVEALFGWVSRAFAGDERYNNLMDAFAAIFGEDAKYASMVEQAVASLPGESDEVGEPLPLELRERGSLGAMGAGQWTGSPHRVVEPFSGPLSDPVSGFRRPVPHAASRPPRRAPARQRGGVGQQLAARREADAGKGAAAGLRGALGPCALNAVRAAIWAWRWEGLAWP